jgi:hypothetical protein
MTFGGGSVTFTKNRELMLNNHSSWSSCSVESISRTLRF